jgi:hypothetical protein
VYDRQAQTNHLLLCSNQQKKNIRFLRLCDKYNLGNIPSDVYTVEIFVDIIIIIVIIILVFEALAAVRR